MWKSFLENKCWNIMQEKNAHDRVGFIKSTDHRPTDQRSTDHLPLTHQPTNHRPTDPPTHRPNSHQPNNKIIFKRLDDWEIFILLNTNAAGKKKLQFRLFSICLNRMKVFRALSLYNYVCFLGCNLLLSIHGNFCKTRCFFHFFYNSVQQENMLNLGAWRSFCWTYLTNLFNIK